MRTNVMGLEFGGPSTPLALVVLDKKTLTILEIQVVLAGATWAEKKAHILALRDRFQPVCTIGGDDGIMGRYYEALRPDWLTLAHYAPAASHDLLMALWTNLPQLAEALGLRYTYDGGFDLGPQAPVLMALAYALHAAHRRTGPLDYLKQKLLSR